VAKIDTLWKPPQVKLSITADNQGCWVFFKNKRAAARMGELSESLYFDTQMVNGISGKLARHWYQAL